MPEPTIERNGEPLHPDVRYEHSDVSFPGIMTVLGVLMFCGVLNFFFVWLVFYRIGVQQDVVKKSPYPLALEPSEVLPREPRLEQVDRMAGIDKPNVYVRESDRLKVLDSYGPSEEDGYVHIPIERAMEMLADKLPARKEPPAEQRRRSGGLVDAGESNSGRMFRGGVK